MSSDAGIKKHKYRLVPLVEGCTTAQDAGIVVIKFLTWDHLDKKPRHRLHTENPNGILRMCVKMYKDVAFAEELDERDITEHSGGCRINDPYYVGDSVTFKPVNRDGSE